MRPITALIAALVLVLAGCSGDGDEAAPAEEPKTTAQTTDESTTTSQPATQAAEEIATKVVFDGETCSYQGPVVVPDGAKVTFEFEATAKADLVALVVGRVDEGTTWDQMIEFAATNSAQLAPPWLKPGYSFIIGPGSMIKTLGQGDYVVTCNTAPGDTNTAHPAALIEVMARAVEARVVFDGETCSYQGPVVVPDGAKVTFEFEATAKADLVALVVGRVDEGTTWDQMIEFAATNSAQLAPPWLQPGYRTHIGPGSLVMTLGQGDYVVTCNTAPGDTDTVHPAALIEVIEG